MSDTERTMSYLHPHNHRHPWSKCDHRELLERLLARAKQARDCASEGAAIAYSSDERSYELGHQAAQDGWAWYLKQELDR